MDSEIPLVRQLLEEDEGRKSRMYKCSEGYNTIGIGHNLDKNPISDAVIDLIFEEDIEQSLLTVKQYDYYDGLSPERKAALLNMAFQMGAAGLAKFKQMHLALARGDYEAAEYACLDSLYAKQTPRRAMKIGRIIRTGEIL